MITNKYHDFVFIGNTFASSWYQCMNCGKIATCIDMLNLKFEDCQPTKEKE